MKYTANDIKLTHDTWMRIPFGHNHTILVSESFLLSMTWAITFLSLSISNMLAIWNCVILMISSKCFTSARFQRFLQKVWMNHDPVGDRYDLLPLNVKVIHISRKKTYQTYKYHFCGIKNLLCDINWLIIDLLYIFKISAQSYLY